MGEGVAGGGGGEGGGVGVGGGWGVAGGGGGGGGGAGRGVGCTHIVHDRSHKTIDPRLPTMPGRKAVAEMLLPGHGIFNNSATEHGGCGGIAFGLSSRGSKTT